MHSLKTLETEWNTNLFDTQSKFSWSERFVSQAVETMLPRWNTHLDAPEYSGYNRSLSRKENDRIRIDFKTDRLAYLLGFSAKFSVIDLVTKHNATNGAGKIPGTVSGSALKYLPAAGLTGIEYIGLPKNTAETLARLRLYPVGTILKMPAWCWPLIANAELSKWMRRLGESVVPSVKRLLEDNLIVESMTKDVIFNNAILFSSLGFTRNDCIFIDIAAAYRDPEILEQLRLP